MWEILHWFQVERTSWPKRKSRKAMRRRVKERFYSELQRPRADPASEQRDVCNRREGNEKSTKD